MIAPGRDLSADELNSAWTATKQFFRECPTCSQIVCVPDFDEPTGFCKEDSPRRAEVEAAQAQQSAAALKGLADVFGISAAMKQSMAAAARASTAVATCPKDGTTAPAGVKFCPNCGTQMTQPVAAAAAATACTSCGTSIAPGVKFCSNCGTAAAGPWPPGRLTQPNESRRRRRHPAIRLTIHRG